MTKETFCFDNFFKDSEMATFEQAIEKNLPARPAPAINFGPFAGHVMAEYVNLINATEAIDLLMGRLQQVFDEPIYLNYFSLVKLFKPWDIHSDFYLNLCPDGQKPHFTLLIPMDNVPSRTIIFDQYTSSSSDFFDYKSEHEPVENTVDEQFWQENLSMCWPHDRSYVTIKQVMPWQRRGQLQGFHRKYFHSSDNFHEKFSQPKCFLNVRLCTDADKNFT
jgi:hypothetical protein